MRKDKFIGAILITFGVLFLLDNLGIADVGDIFHDFWPLILVLWGLSILRRGKRPASPVQSVSAQPVDRELLHESSIFGDTFLNVTSTNFKGGSVSTVFGDADVDLSQAVVADGEHELRLRGVFGDSSVTLPKDTAVSIAAKSRFGSVMVLGQRKDGFSSEVLVTSPEYDTSPKRLRISLTKVFGAARIG
ncbi:MAG TPA: cell wall-active antibiotics response protein LiaF [Bacteroidota bacterium]|nr:cell wall-active antibiotics response protein LiaF [Bacteroidota bacterium]